MRITTSAILRNYQNGLGKAATQLNGDRNKVLSQRSFSTAAENPAAATQAFKLRKSYESNSNYISNTEDAISKLETVESSGLEMHTVAKSAKSLVLQAINGSTSEEGRKTIAASLRGYQETLVLSANAKYGDDFIFGGANNSEAPFELVNGRLQYFGIDVNTTDTTEKATLNKLASEEVLVDLGFGLEVDGTGGLSTVTSGTAFCTSTSGLDALGYGIDANGNDKNLVNLLGQIADELEADGFDTEKTSKLSLQFESSCSTLMNFVTELGTKSNYLGNTLSRLEANKSTLNEKITSLESIDLAEAITNYSWSQYAYNAALKVGNSILSQSFIDYMS